MTNIAVLQQSVMNTLVDGFFETKKLEIKAKLKNSLDVIVDDLFGQLVVQVKQLLLVPSPNVAETIGGDQLSNKDTNYSNQSTPIVSCTNVTSVNNKNTKSNKFFSLRQPTTSNTMVDHYKQVEIEIDSRTIQMEVSHPSNNEELNNQMQDQYEMSDKENNFEQITPLKSSKFKFTCQTPGCTKSYKHEYELKRHRRFHLGIKPYHCKWESCSYSSEDKTNTLRHIQCNHIKKCTLPQSETIEAKDYLMVDQQLLEQMLNGT
ncbi:hypothetical protein RDWZM_000130 [Blomia tropicalis]|uniref:C2H2-type domain-containing protein n=1 Tax=Blomia tropicalis TaxID=40697 RepID=A0A9Q0MD33_BLOTA|nr:hypothetical protein RDWZM_000130 [Blomia tropicalis]